MYRQSLHKDHILPKFKGGSEDLSNIQLICANCHEDKTREDLRGRPSPALGLVHSEQTRTRMSEANRGEANYSAKLTAAQVRELRQRFSKGETQKALSKAFGVSLGTVGRITRGESWMMSAEELAQELTS